MVRPIEEIVEEVRQLNPDLGEELNTRLWLFAAQLRAKQQELEVALTEVLEELRKG